MKDNKKCICEQEYIYLNSGLSIEIRNGSMEFDYSHCACGSFEDKIEIKFCPQCGKKLDTRKEVPEHLEPFKELFKFMKGNCEKQSGLKDQGEGISCEDCFFGGDNGKSFHCNRVIDLLSDANKKYKLDK